MMTPQACTPVLRIEPSRILACLMVSASSPAPSARDFNRFTASISSERSTSFSPFSSIEKILLSLRFGISLAISYAVFCLKKKKELGVPMLSTIGMVLVTAKGLGRQSWYSVVHHGARTHLTTNAG